MKNANLKVEAGTNQPLFERGKGGERVLELSVVAPKTEAREKRPVMNLGLVIDRSGSMSGNKLHFARQAACHVLDLLEDNDQVSLVFYDSDVHGVEKALKATTENRNELRRMINGLESGSSTNLGGGWLEGCRLIADALLPEGVNRVLLMTDGLANQGIVDQQELGRHAAEIHRRGVSTSTFGIGLDFNEHLLEHMSDQGGGNFHFIENPMDIPQLFCAELSGLAEITARDVELVVELPKGVKAKVLGEWKHEMAGDKVRVFIGHLAGGLKRNVYLKLDLNPEDGNESLKFNVHAQARAKNDAYLAADVEIVFSAATKEEVKARPADEELLKRYTTVVLADAATEALIMERRGLRREASDHMRLNMQMSEPFMDESQNLRYGELSKNMRSGLNEVDRKRSHHQEYLHKQNKEEYLRELKNRENSQNQQPGEPGKI